MDGKHDCMLQPGILESRLVGLSVKLPARLAVQSVPVAWLIVFWLAPHYALESLDRGGVDHDTGCGWIAGNYIDIYIASYMASYSRPCMLHQRNHRVPHEKDA